MSRLYVDSSLAIGQELILPKESAHYLLNVLRLRLGALVTLFNGQGGEYLANLVAIAKKDAKLQVQEYKPVDRESKLQLCLVQAISRPEHMDHTIQKAVELGVQQIVPVITERSAPLALARISKREQHWRKIIISACEQSGRNRLPILYNVQTLSSWLAKAQQGMCLVLSPNGKNTLPNALTTQPQNVTVFIGAEGGLSETEIEQAKQAGYLDVSLGPRILRTETAAVTVLAICQGMVGDFKDLNK
jgi:16S rRNA (uracil1498-N3)-methyltransferase